MTNVPKVGQKSYDATLQGRRDAFHVPGVLVATDQILLGGESVRFTDSECTKVTTCSGNARHAIVDPFLGQVGGGVLFWVLLVPELTTNLVHHFDINTAPVEDVEDDDEDEDDNCKGCYEPDDEDDDGSCKGCYD